ncbi:hypothetical protein M5G22_16995, partial [Pseudomonas sp. TNT2022 ID233]|uniref:hypothetical protein n=1 Tax=Pseudomonas aphyarum TaxID=2942629 RepID=UPI00235E2439
MSPVHTIPQLPAQAWHGHHAAPAQGADKDEGRVSRASIGYLNLSQKLRHSMTRNSYMPGRHCSRSDGPADAPNIMGKS